jgi:hypothetical protein
MKTKQKNDFWDLVDEALESRTAYDTIRILKAKGASDDEIKSELQKRHGLNALQCSQALREYVEEQRKEVKDV